MSEELVTACPECDSTQIQCRPRAPDSETWLCRKCKAVFGDPVTRTSRNRQGDPRSGLSKHLLELDASEVGR